MTEDLDRSRAFEKTVGRALKDRVDFAGTSVSVSYTHLDVYKRQLYLRPPRRGTVQYIPGENRIHKCQEKS